MAEHRWHISGRVPSIKSVMTAFPYSLNAEATIGEARSLMAAHEISHLPIQQDHLPVGLVHDQDLEAMAAETPLRDVMHTEVFVVDMNQPLDEVLLHMAENHIDSTTVVRDGRLAGIFTATDACRLLGSKLAELAGRGGEEDGIA